MGDPSRPGHHRESHLFYGGPRAVFKLVSVSVSKAGDQFTVSETHVSNSTWNCSATAAADRIVEQDKLTSVTVNLSNLELSKSDVELLDKGLTFIPTVNSVPLFKFYEAQNRLIRNLKIKDYFSNRSNKDYDYRNKSFTPATNWTPPDHHVGRSTLDTIQEIVTSTESVLDKSKIHKNRFLILNNRRCNLTNSEKLSLDKIRMDNSIVIKPADKGGATVIMNKSSYLNEAYRQLNNENYYKKLDAPLFHDNVDKINNILKTMVSDGIINSKQFKFLQASKDDKCRIFYLLPKIHKPRDRWPQTDMPEGRPIVSDCGSESYRVSQFIDSHVRPISIKHSAYIKDTYDFISKIRGRTVPRNAFLVTGDVTALYTNMNIERTLLVTKQALAKHCPLQAKCNQHLLDLLEITLKNNDFEFNGDYFLQICGTAMGKSYAPGLADLYMQELDDKACHDFHPELLEFYFRFLDDVFFTWYGSMAEIKEFECFLNTLIPGIKITFNVSSESIHFLDTTIYKSYDDTTGQCTLLTKVYFKETDTHQLVHKSSFHPKHTFRGVLKSQLLRFKRISSSVSDYDSACKILFDSLSKRNYSKSLLRKMKRDVWKLPEIGRNSESNKTKKELLPIVIPFCHTGNSLARNWKSFVGQNDKFQNFRPITAYCNSSNLRQKLVRGSLSNNITVNRRSCVNYADGGKLGMHRCTSSRCRACNYITVDIKFKSSYNARYFNIKYNFTCKSTNIIYLVTCKQCDKQYVGQTGRALADRICDHLSNIRTRKPTPISLHFNLPNHCLTDFTITAIEQIPDTGNALSLRLTKEITWQNLLQTAYPLGINNLKPEYLI